MNFAVKHVFKKMPFTFHSSQFKASRIPLLAVVCGLKQELNLFSVAQEAGIIQL